MWGHVPEHRQGLSLRQPVLCAPDEPSKDKEIQIILLNWDLRLNKDKSPKF